MGMKVNFYRATCFRRPVGPWRISRRQAYRDAIEQGLGGYDEHGQFYVTVPGDIQVATTLDYLEVDCAALHARRAPNDAAHHLERLAANDQIAMRIVG